MFLQNTQAQKTAAHRLPFFISRKSCYQALLVRHLNRKIKPTPRPRRQINRPFVNPLRNINPVYPRRVTNAEIQVLAVEANAQLVVQEGLGKGFVRDFRLLAEDQLGDVRAEFGRWLCPGQFVDWQQQGAAQESAWLTELFVDDMDGQLRQEGIGDVVVGKHVGRMMSALGGRISAYRAALQTGTGLDEALRRNLYRGAEVPDAAVAHVEGALRERWVRLGCLSRDALLAGDIG